MAIIGGQINPALYPQPNYSGVVQSAQMQAQGMANLGASIGGVIKDFGDQKKQINQDIAKGKSALQFAKANYPELAGRIDEIGKIFSDVNVSKADQAAAGSQMGEFVTAMIRGQEFNTEIGLKKRALEIQAAEALARNAPQPITYDFKPVEVPTVVNGVTGVMRVLEDANTGRIKTSDGVEYLNFEDAKAKRNPIGQESISNNAVTSNVIDAGLNAGIPTSATNAERKSIAINNALALPTSTQPDNSEPASVLFGGDFPDGVAPLGTPMVDGTATTNITPTVDGPPVTNVQQIPANKEATTNFPVGFIADEVKPEVAERAMTDAERIAANLPAGQYMARFTGDKPSNIKQITTAPDSLERLKENRMLKADDRISAVIESTDKGGERLINMNEALSLLNSGEVKSGSFGSYKVKAARLLGMDVASEEQFNSLVGNLALEAIDLTKGAISDREMTFFREELAPGINKSVDGNKKIIEFKIAAAKRGLRINQVAREMLANNALPADIEAAIKKIQNEQSLVPSNTTDQSTPERPQSAADRLRALPPVQ